MVVVSLWVWLLYVCGYGFSEFLGVVVVGMVVVSF